MIRRRLVIPLILPILLLVALAPTVSAATNTSQEQRILLWINQARAERHLVPLRSDYRVWALAGDRAAVMASHDMLSHTVAGVVGTQLSSRGIKWYGWGDAIAYTYRPKGTYATADLFALWKGSQSHWDLLMSPGFNYVGIGVIFDAGTGKTYGDVVLIDGPDRSPPGAAMVSVTRDVDDVVWTWRGWDLILQKRTAGLAYFDIQYRVDSGTFRNIGTATIRTSTSLTNRPHRHWYGLRVRARDGAGNIGAWSSEMRVWVP
jgi:hypothetical protein